MEKHINIRQDIRAGRFTGSTAGFCEGLIQANVVILPADFAEPFVEYCYLNPKPCPLIALGDKGNPLLTNAGPDIDIRSDVPRYIVYKDGVLATELNSVSDIWQDDFVPFALGCSHSFEHGLMSKGIPMKHVQNQTVVPMYRTNVATVPNEVFSGPLVVSMRPILKSLVDEVVAISSGFPHSHGSPIHIGDPSEIGIFNLDAPDWGDSVEIDKDEIPVFWACGVTSQRAIENARPPIAITHRPGSMLITKLPEDSDLLIPGL